MSGLSQLAKRCVDLSFRHKLSHVSSVLNTVDLLADIYRKRKPDEPVVVANGHAGLALYVVLESHGMCDAEEMIAKHGVHPSRDMKHGIWCSTGSLGLGETVAVGMALADETRVVWLVTSDGSCMEGSAWEAMRIVRTRRLVNINVYCVFNGYGAYGVISRQELPSNAIIHNVLENPTLPNWLGGLAGHYLILTEAQRDELMA